eukprot:Skav225660  [mRNA]  locus=scaffold1924:17142:20256:+ [translate_table: standard]
MCAAVASSILEEPVLSSAIANPGAMASRFAALVPLLGAVPFGMAMKCPGSPSWVHASAEVEGIAGATCKEVMEEIKARVAGDWHDPHNGGHYSLLNESVLELDLQRVTGNGLFTDKMIFTFSEFQGSGKEDGCEPVKHDFVTTEIEVKPSSFAGTDKLACRVTGEASSPASPGSLGMPLGMLRKSKLLGDTVDDTLACINDNCPLDESTLSPKPSCVLGNCSSHLTKCLFSSSCRHGVMCELKCTEPLAKTEDAKHFASLMECMRVHCPGFPPSKSCAALHCSAEAAECAVHSKCRETLECADKCVPGKYTAALAVMPHETVV